MKINLIEIKNSVRRFFFLSKREFLTLENLVIFLGIAMILFWAWGSVSAMARNHSLQQELERKKREEILAEIEKETVKFEQNYLKSAEFQELAAREKLGLVAEGESVLILPDYPEEKKVEARQVKKRSNLSEWMNFLFGGNAQKIN